MTGTERKVFQKYYPPDFDPRKIPKAKCPRNRQFVQRVMTPFNMQCNTCAEYIYKGKKFNMRRETAEGELYLGLRIFRFYFRCPNCLAEITFKTDLENCDYANEHGATRLFEAVKLMQEQDKEVQKQDEEDQNNPMKMLEKRTKMSRAEMEALGNLEELREMNRRLSDVDYEGLLSNYKAAEEDDLRRQEEKDEQFVKSIFGPKEETKMKRILDDDEDEEDKPGTSKIDDDFSKDSIFQIKSIKSPDKAVKRAKISSQKELLKGLVVVKKKTIKAEERDEVEKPEPSEETVHSNTSATVDNKSATVICTNSGLSLLGGYGSNSSGSDSE